MKAISVYVLAFAAILFTARDSKKTPSSYVKAFARLSCSLVLFVFSVVTFAQQKQPSWVCIVDDEVTTICFDSNNISRDQRGNYVVWVRTDFHTADWQQYFTRQVNSKTRVVRTKVKAVYNDYFSDAMVRDVYCYDRNNRQVAHRNEASAGWSPVNAADPVGIVGEFLSDNIDRVLGRSPYDDQDE